MVYIMWKIAQLIAFYLLLAGKVTPSIADSSGVCSSPVHALSSSLMQRQRILTPKQGSHKARRRTEVVEHAKKTSKYATAQLEEEEGVEEEEQDEATEEHAKKSSKHTNAERAEEEDEVEEEEQDEATEEHAKKSSKHTNAQRAEEEDEVEKEEQDEANEAAKVDLPTFLVELGVKLFGSREHLDSVVEKSLLVPMSFANVKMDIRIAHGDDADSRLPGENGDGYGLDTLMELRNPEGMINIVDMGGNYGTVTIAAYRKYPYLVRAAVAEPIPATFFFLRWNMYLNNVTVYDETEFTAHPREAGVVLLHKAVSAKGDTELRICEMPWSTMNAHLSYDEHTCKCDKEEMHCAEVPSVAAEDMVNLFGHEDITLWKLDCEGCEASALPAIANGPHASRVKRLVGELHDPDPDVVEMACRWDNGIFFTAFCRGGVNRVDGPDVCARCTYWE